MLENSLTRDGKGVMTVAGCNVENCLCGAYRGLEKPLARRVLTHKTENRFVMRCYLLDQLRVMFADSSHCFLLYNYNLTFHDAHLGRKLREGAF